MTVEVLKHRTQVTEARAAMKRRGIDCASTVAQRVLRRLGALRGVNVGDRRKSWDILKTVEFIESRLSRDAPVLDIGAHECEILPILRRLGYENLTGVDLNPRIGQMPDAAAIRYIRGDFMRTPCEPESFSCVTAISVIEHGFDGRKLLSELSRLLKPGGFFIASVDYWPDKIETSGIRAYGMDWTIFSRSELGDFLIEAGDCGFLPVGDTDYEAVERVARWMGRRYTFAWIVMRKVA